jgi:hypothetical protein
MVQNGEHISTHKVDYRGGDKYPHLEREGGKPDMFANILRPIAP